MSPTGAAASPGVLAALVLTPPETREPPAVWTVRELADGPSPAHYLARGHTRLANAVTVCA